MADDLSGIADEDPLSERLSRIERRMAQLASQMTPAFGEALFSSALIPFLLVSAIRNGSLNLEDVRSVLDESLLSAEAQAATARAPDVLTYVRARLDTQLTFLFAFFDPPPVLM
jgi:hypothetical protein